MFIKKNATTFYIFITSIILITWLAYFVQTKILFSPDVGYLLLAADQMLAGGHYAKAFFETNPPMILYLYFPVCLLAKHAAITIFTALRLYIISLSLISAALNFFLLKKLMKEQDKILIYFLFYTLLLTMLFLPLFVFGQREHVLLIVMLPYLFSAALALEKKSIPQSLALLIGLLAGVGFAIKPFFLAVPFLIELYFIVKQRSLFAWVRTESIVILFVLVSYGVSLFMFQPEYIHIITPLLFHYYFPTTRDPWSALLTLPNVLFCLSMIISYCFIHQYDRYPTLGRVLFLALIGMAIAFLIPQTPWYYHVLPAFGLSILLLAHLAGQIISGFLSIFLASLAGIILLFLPFNNCYQLLNYIHQLKKQVPSTQINAYFSQHQIPQAHRSITCFGVKTLDCFPLVYLTNSHYGSRYPAFWWFVGLRTLEKNGQLVAQIQNKNYFINIIADDLTRDHTQLVLINEKAFKEIENKQFDIVHYLSENKKFREAWRHYHYVMTVYPYKIYQLKGIF